MMGSATFCDPPRALALPPVRADLAEAARCWGLNNLSADPAAAELLQAQVQTVTAAAQPRMAWGSLSVSDLEMLGLLPGQDIRTHLIGCDRAILLAVTLGSRADAAVRRAGVGNVARLTAADAAASALAEAAARAAERILQEEFSTRGLYLTGRYSPGYGDWPLGVQSRLCALLDTPRLLGLTVSESSLLLPRKSVTALLGIGSRPVSGHRAGCGHCTLRERCEYRKRGQTCEDP